MNQANDQNPLGLNGIAFVEYASPSPEGEAELNRLFGSLGFSKLNRHPSLNILDYVQHNVHFLVNREATSHANDFAKAHGGCVSALGWWVKDAELALARAVERGAKAYTGPIAYHGARAIYGIGGSLIYLVEERVGRRWNDDFLALEQPEHHPSRGFYRVDHLTNNVHKGTMQEWASFYKEVFGFTEVRYFDIRGQKTGLTSYALRSPCGQFCIPINEGDESKSQIEEYLREYAGPGVQHIALLSDDLLSSLQGLEEAGVPTLDIDSEYYENVFERVPGVTEDHARIAALKVLVDGDDDGYLLQIFTRNVIGPIFFEMIQRRNHLSFGEGNFSALFRSIERDQERRGVL
ncbi:MAG: 4-hydroxyphenylpyruvate dioxygenase [Polyangiaceae bacterium]|nr:4-hydroxyphenylpyruvate dioxygenase [Polyangiaceae bacterium]